MLGVCSASLLATNLSDDDVYRADMSRANMLNAVTYSTNFASARLCDTTLYNGKVNSTTCTSIPPFPAGVGTF
ncbi:MAG TPA: hypothetical protein VGF81_05505 [Solirubrobacteraceae bacterium]